MCTEAFSCVNATTALSKSVKLHPTIEYMGCSYCGTGPITSRNKSKNGCGDWLQEITIENTQLHLGMETKTN